MKGAVALVERHFPPNGPCFLCGPPLCARHRVTDAIRERVWAGDSVAETAEDFGIPEEVVEALLSLRGRNCTRIMELPKETNATAHRQTRDDSHAK